MHGGKSLAGVASPNFKTGRHSQDLPLRLRARYGDRIADPNLLSLADDIALTDTRIGELLAKLPDDEETARTWNAFTLHFAAARAAYSRARDKRRTEEQRADAQAEFWQAFEAAEMLYEEGMKAQSDASEIWSGVAFFAGEKRKAVETEITRIARATEMITRDQAAMLVAGIAAVIRANVNDRTALQRIQDGIRRLVSFSPGR